MYLKQSSGSFLPQELLAVVRLLIFSCSQNQRLTKLFSCLSSLKQRRKFCILHQFFILSSTPVVEYWEYTKNSMSPNSHLPLMFNAHSDEDTVSKSLSLRLFWVCPTFVLGQVSVLFILALGNSSQRRCFHPSSVRLVSSWQDAIIPLLPVSSHISQKARMQFTLFVACHCGRKSGY